MATGGQKEVEWNLVKVRTLKLKVPYKSPWYESIVVCQDKIVVIDYNACKVQLFRLHDGKLLATTARLESRPRDLCLMDAMTICVLHEDGLIEMVSIDSTDISRVLKTTRSLRLQGVMDVYRGVVRFKDNLVVSGVKQDTIYWCIVSLDDGHVDTFQQICKWDVWCDSRMTTKDNIIYFSCHAGVNTGVYGFDILNPTRCKYTYKHQRLQSPTSIVINEDGNIFVCNGLLDSCIHQLTASCQLVAIFTQGIPRYPIAMFWDNGCLYVTRWESSDITVFQPVYQEGELLIHRLMPSLGLGRFQKKLPIKHSQAYKSPWYESIVVYQDKIVVIDYNACKVQLFRLHDGKLLASTARLESRPRDLCLMDAMTFCVLHEDGLIEMVSIDSTYISSVLKTTRSLRLQGVMDVYRGVVRFKDNLVVSGVKQDTIYWCIVSLDDGHVDTFQQICKWDVWCDSRMTTKDNIIYISCHAGVNTGVYGFDILNPTRCKYTYKHQRLQSPTSIVINEDGNIFVCNGLLDSCIHHLTASCQLVAIFTQGIPRYPIAMFWDNGRLYVTRWDSGDITVFQPVYQEGELLIHRLMHSPSHGRFQKKLPIKHSQADQTVPDVLVRDEKKQPVAEKTSAVIEHSVVDERQLGIENELSTAIQVPADSDVDNQGPVIPVEILRMDDKSLMLYKEALRDGKEKVFNIRVMVVGQYGVGKTTLTKHLLGQKVDISERKSTEGIDVHKHCCKIAMDTGEWIVENEASDQLFRLQRLVKLLTGQTERPEGSGEQKGHTEVICQRETTPDELHGPVHDSEDDDDASSDRAVIFINDLSDSSESDIDNVFEANSVTIHNSGRRVTTDQEADITKNQPEGSSSVNADQRPPTLEMGGIAVQESKSLVTSKDDAMIEFLQLVNEKADKMEKSIVEYAALAMWDFAGQYVFYTTHQTFLTCRAIYLLVTDLSKQVTDFVEDDECFFDIEGVKLCQVQDLVEVWMNSIHCCAPSSVANTPVTSPAAAITMTTSLANTPLTSPAAAITITSVANTPVTSPAAAITMKNSVANTPLTSPAAAITMKNSVANTPVTSPAAVVTMTTSVANTAVTSPAAATTMTTSVANTPVISPAVAITMTTSVANTPVTSPAAAITITTSVANTPVTSPAAAITMTTFVANTPVTSPAAAITMTTSVANTALISHGASNLATSTDIGISVTPPVILVSTHADKIRQDKRREIIKKYFDQICFILKDKPSFQHLKDYFPIDNTQFDPQLETLKKRIFELASKQPYWGQEVPANWLPLESSLMKLKASGIKVIPHSLVEEMNQAGAVPIKTTEQLDLFLRFQHETGNFIYFSVEGLKEWLVLDPAWLIDALKSLITADTFIFKNNPVIQSKFFEFRDKGKLTAELIDAIWTRAKHPEFHYYKEIILQLMEKLNIVARPRLYNQDAEEVKVEGYLLAPCMLRQTTPKELISFGPNSQQGNTSVICFVFTGKFLPSPVFHRLLAACVAQWPIARKKMENLIFCGCCLFDLDLLHRLTVLFREHVIFAGVTRIGTTEKNPSSKLCIEVREFITRTLSSIIGCLGQSIQFELSIQCPNSDRYSVHCHIPVAILQGNVEVPCHFHDNSHVIISHDVLKFWFQEEEESADGSSAGTMPSQPTSDTDRFMCIAYLLNDVGSKVLRKLFHHLVVTPSCTLDQHLANNRSTIDSLLKKRVLNPSQMDIMFPPNGDDTNLNDYDITLLSALSNNIVPFLGHQEMNLVKGLRDDRNKLYGHTKSCMMNANDFQTCWSNISSTLITLSQQCGDPIFETEMLKEIQQTRVPDASYLSILQAWFRRVERVEKRLIQAKHLPQVRQRYDSV